MLQEVETVVEDTLSVSADTVNEVVAAFTNLVGEDGKISSESFNSLISALVNQGLDFGGKLLAAIVVFLIGRWICKHTRRIIGNILEKRNVDVSLTSFINSLVGLLLNFFLFIIVIALLGINTSSFIALLGAAGLALGMAASGALQNFAGGVIILLLKPFRVGDFVEAQGFTGTIKEIQIFNTIICTPDNKLITIPNGGLSTGVSTNYSMETIRRVDWEFCIAYGNSYDTAKEVIKKLLDADSRVLKDPAYFIALGKMDASSVNITVRAWTDNANYWGLYFDMNEKIYKTFTEEKDLSIPFNQLDVHVIKE